MIRRLSAVALVGMITLTGCGGGADSQLAMEPCFENSQVLQVQYDWGYLVAGARAYASDKELSDKAWTYAQQVEDLAYTVEDDRQCTGKRESLELTLQALELFKAMDEGTLTESHYEEAAQAGESFMDVMKLEEQGYATNQLTFNTRIDDPDKHDGRVSDEPCFTVDDIGSGIAQDWNRIIDTRGDEEQREYISNMSDRGSDLLDTTEFESYPICAGYGQIAEINQKVATLNLDVLLGHDTDEQYQEIADLGNELLEVSDARENERNYKFTTSAGE